MARSTDAVPKAQRGFVPASSEDERYLMRHIEDIARAACSRCTARYSSFLSDREQELASAAMDRVGAGEVWRFDGGWPGAERRILCVEPDGCRGCESPIRCVKLSCRAAHGVPLPAHKDYLGSLMGLEINREALGDIVLLPESPGTAYVFALKTAAELICRELKQAGKAELEASPQPIDELPAFAETERETLTATVPSLRLDAVLAAMLRCSRGAAAELIAAGRVEINHLPTASAHAQVFEGDVFTVRGKGRFGLTALPGKSKKDRTVIEFFQY